MLLDIVLYGWFYAPIVVPVLYLLYRQRELRAAPLDLSVKHTLMAWGAFGLFLVILTVLLYRQRDDFYQSSFRLMFFTGLVLLIIWTAVSIMGYRQREHLSDTGSTIVKLSLVMGCTVWVFWFWLPALMLLAVVLE